MTPKDLLLQKGFTEEEADQMITALSEKETQNPLPLLKAVLTKKPDEVFGKAAAKEEDDEDYSADYMKKHMKRFMKENKESYTDMEDDSDMAKKKMKKAVEEMDPDADGAVLDMVDLKPYLTAQGKTIETLAKAVKAINETLEVVMTQGAQNYHLAEATAAVNVETAEMLQKAMGKSMGRKGQTVDEKMQKAIETKHADSETKWQALFKATQNGDPRAGSIIGVFESNNRSTKNLPKSDVLYIDELVKAGGA